MNLVDLHARLGNTVLLYNAAIGLWGLSAYFRKAGVGPSFRGALVIGELLYVAQALVGVTLWATSGEPGRWVHILYGTLMVISLPATFVYTRGQDERREALIYGVVGLFLVGVALRAITTA